MVRDITERKRRRRQVSVLSRLLRHNLRNDMNVVIGQAEFVESETDDERVRDAVRKIQTKASDLVDLSQRVRDLQALIQKSGTEDEEVTVRPLVEAVVSEARAGYPAADITVDVPDETVVYATRQTLAWAVSNLVENAVEHNDAENPSVTVSAELAEERRGEWVALTVSDDGPGIPEFERSVATDAHEQTDLAHATGIGLWIVGQVVEAFDGSIAFADGGDGSEVTLYLQGTVDAGAVAT
jgi:signal transduction histidine kinase